METYELDEIDKKLLQLIHDEIPLTERPWAEIGKKLNLTEEEVMSRISSLRKKGIIKYIGPAVNSKMMGSHASTLVAMKVPYEKLERAVKVINEYREVFHNFLRNHEYNVWFTVVAPDEARLNRILEEIKHKIGVPDENILNMPTVRCFKINVRFQLI